MIQVKRTHYLVVVSQVCRFDALLVKRNSNANIFEDFNC